MKKRKAFQLVVLSAAAMSLTGAALEGQSPSATAPDRIVATINAEQTSEPVSRYEYGMFANT